MNVLTAESDRSLSIACITNNVGVNGQDTSASEQFHSPAAERDAQYQYHSDVSPKPGDVLTAALSYAARGWQVIPLHSPRQDGCSCKSRRCQRVGKHPRTRHGLKDATTDPTQIRKWFKMWPDANVGIVTGKESGLVVLDVDDGGECRGSDTLAGLLQTHNDSVSTMIVSTGNGRHIYYRHPGGTVKNSAGQLGVGLDVRADGGYVVAAPSRHVNGRTYTIEQDLEVEDLPDRLRAMIDARMPNQSAIELIGPYGLSRLEPTIEGSRNNELFKLACRLRGREGMEQRDLERVLMSYNEEICVPPLGIEEVLQIVASACRYPVEKTAEKSLKRQNENPLYWFRFDVRHWFSDQNLNAMRDDQTGWHIRLIVFAWNKGGFLTSDPAQLWRLAGAKSCSHFIKHCSLVLADFDMVTECDGTVVLRHRFMAAEYAATLQKWMQKVSSGKKGGGSGALGVLSKVDGCADVMPWPEQNSFDISACAAESYDEYLTPQEVAAILKISTDSVIRRFKSRPGVIDLGSSETRFKRRYRVFRIPRQTLERFILENRICA
jgi:Bifunctional DNA primase/polymerase, N-terminal/Primase C terminal 1 (PriCT-1)